MDDTIFLADEIRDKLDAGLLPLMLPGRIWGGCGHGDTCSACERPIVPAQLEYCLVMQDDSDKPLRFHFHCLGLWLAALRRRGIELESGRLLDGQVAAFGALKDVHETGSALET